MSLKKVLVGITAAGFLITTGCAVVSLINAYKHNEQTYEGLAKSFLVHAAKIRLEYAQYADSKNDKTRALQEAIKATFLLAPNDNAFMQVEEEDAQSEEYSPVYNQTAKVIANLTQAQLVSINGGKKDTVVAWRKLACDQLKQSDRPKQCKF